MVPPLTAVTAVAAVILILLALNSQPIPPGPGPGAVAQLPAADSHRGAIPTVSALPVHQPPATQAPARTTRSTSPAPAVSHPAAAPAVGADRAPVTVLNNSRFSGLAHRVADQVRAAGWTIRQVGNFRGRIRTSTAYYAPGGHAAAVALARRFPQIRRVLPRFAGLPGAGLTLVVTRNW